MQLRARTQNANIEDDEATPIDLGSTSDNDRGEPEARKRKKGTRKDIDGVGNLIDDYATNILIKNKASGLLEYKKAV